MPGLRLTADGADVAVVAPHAELVEVCLFDASGTETRHPLRADGTGLHLGSIAGVSSGQRYGLRTHGPWDPRRGLWHHPSLLLLDPFARAVTGSYYDHPSTRHSGPRVDSAPFVPRGVAIADPLRPRPGPKVPWEETVIYETHVRGLSMLHPEVEPALRGTYRGAASPPIVEHLLGLGVTTVELMPVGHHVSEPFLQARGAANYWGYSTLAWFAPHGGYATADDGRQVAEFAQMIDAFHAAGLEVIIDVVFNHTAEGSTTGPILSMKGLDNPGWYRLDPSGAYVDWTGTGNTIHTGRAAVREAILDALDWWSAGLGIDGFRFDLAVTLGRQEKAFAASHLDWLTGDHRLAGLKLIVEPWDLGPGGYQLGRFGNGWSEWNGRYRDDIRDLWRGRGDTSLTATRIGGSSDVFARRGPAASVNFVTAHDGFTLRDLVSYDVKHNAANGEDNRDGHDDNRSWNSGAEGPTPDPVVNETRRRRASALVTTLLFSAGVPMLSGGDELWRTQGGNNNAYALDGPTVWYDWTQAPLSGLISRAIASRRRRPWLGGSSHPPVTAAPDHHVSVVLVGTGEDRLLLALNPTPADHRIGLPVGAWVIELDSSTHLDGGSCEGGVEVPAWSVLVLGPAPRP